MEILSLSSASATSEDLPGSPSGKLFTMQVVLKEKVHVRPWTHAVYVGEGAANVLFRPFLYKKVGKQQKEDGTDADLLTRQFRCLTQDLDHSESLTSSRLPDESSKGT